jgi:hypothetical protein
MANISLWKWVGAVERDARKPALWTNRLTSTPPQRFGTSLFNCRVRHDSVRAAYDRTADADVSSTASAGICHTTASRTHGLSIFMHDFGLYGVA